MMSDWYSFRFYCSVQVSLDMEYLAATETAMATSMVTSTATSTATATAATVIVTAAAWW